MTKTFAMCRIDGLIELREEHPGEGYFALPWATWPACGRRSLQPLSRTRSARKSPGACRV